MTLYFSWAKVFLKVLTFMFLPSSVSFSTHHVLLSGVFDYGTRTRKEEWALAEEKKISLITLGLFAHLPGNGSKYFSIKRNVGLFSPVFPELGSRKYQVSVIMISKTVEFCPD